jgi:hypothetical protein
LGDDFVRDVLVEVGVFNCSAPCTCGFSIKTSAAEFAETPAFVRRQPITMNTKEKK